MISPPSPQAVPDAVAARLEAIADRAARTPGTHAVLAVEDDDGRRWVGAAGPDAAPDSPFFIASITKRFIIALTLQAHERGELDLDSPITEVLPAPLVRGLHVRNGVDRTASITVRHLASHTAGLPDYFERVEGGHSLFRRLRAGRDARWSLEDVLRVTREHQHPHFPPQNLERPRVRARYSDTGYQLLIAALQEATRSTYATLLRERMLAPLNLRDTWLPTHAPDAARTHLPLHDGRRLVSVPGIMASSNDLVSTTSDLLAFERALTAGPLFTDPATRHVLTEQPHRLRNAPVLRYGLGTMLFTVNRLTLPRVGPVTLVGHSGSTGTWLFTCPELRVRLAGTVDRTSAQKRPFRLMAACLRAWTTPA